MMQEKRIKIKMLDVVFVISVHLLLIFAFLTGNVHAAISIPPELAGIWAIDGAEFKGQALFNGQALYLDTDGVGGFVSGDGKNVIGVRIIVTTYNPKDRSLSFDLTENGRTITGDTFIHDPTEKVMFSSKDKKKKYHRRFEVVSSEMRKSLGLEPKAK